MEIGKSFNLAFTSIYYTSNILINKSGESLFCASLQFISVKYTFNILINKSGEKVHFFSASLPCIIMKYSCNIIVNISGEMPVCYLLVSIILLLYTNLRYYVLYIIFKTRVSSRSSVDFVWNRVEVNCRFILSAAVIGLQRQLMNVLGISNLISTLKISFFVFHRRFL